MLKWVAAVVVLAVAAFWVVRLVGGGDEAGVEEAIEAVATSDDPAVCTESATQAYLEQVTGLPGDAAVTACIQTASEPGLLADGVEVIEITIDGDNATALATYDGSTLSGATIQVGLVKSGDEWQLDSRIAMESVDREELAAGLRETLAAPPTSLTEPGAECAAGRLVGLGDAALESALISSDTSTYSKAIIACDRVGYLDSLARDLSAGGYSESLAECVRGRLDAESDGALVGLLDDPVGYTELALACDRDAVLAAYGDLVVSDGESEDAGRCVVSHLDELSDAEIARTAVEIGELDRIYAECGID